MRLQTGAGAQPGAAIQGNRAAWRLARTKPEKRDPKVLLSTNGTSKVPGQTRP